MKKILLSSLLATALFSCTKETPIVKMCLPVTSKDTTQTNQIVTYNLVTQISSYKVDSATYTHYSIGSIFCPN